MSKKGNSGLITVVGIVVILIVGAFLYFNQSQAPDSGSAEPETGISDSLTEPEVGGQYLIYSDGIIEEVLSQGKTPVLYFYANWCPTCQPVDRQFKEEANRLPEDVVVIRINYNDTDTDADEDALAEKYAITYQHTFAILDENAVVTTRWNGAGLERVLEEL